MRLRSLLVVLAVGVAALAVWLLTGRDAESLIRARLVDLTREASREAGEADVVSLATARALTDYFTADCRGADAAGGNVVEGRREIVRAIFWARDATGPVRFEAQDVDVTVADEDHAASRLTVRVTGDDAEGLDGTQATLEWLREDGAWRISSAFVERPAGSGPVPVP
jgi:hypothetical protein